MAEFTILHQSNQYHHSEKCNHYNDEEEEELISSIEKVYIPPEILIEIMEYLDFDSIIMVSGTSRGFHQVYQTNLLWSKLLRNDWKPLKEKSKNNDEDIHFVLLNNTKHDNTIITTTNTYDDHANTTTDNNNTDNNRMIRRSGVDEAATILSFPTATTTSHSYELINGDDGRSSGNDNSIDHHYYFERYKERYLRYKKWRNSIAFIYSEERKQYIHSVDHGERGNGRFVGYLKYLMSFPILFYRLLIFLFISQDEQPDFGLTHEIEYIQEKSLRAGGSLLLLILFLPMVLSIWLIGELPVTPAYVTLHIMLKIIFTVVCFGSHFYNRMDKTIEHYSEANSLSLVILLIMLITLVLMRFVDDFITCCLVAFQMSIALGLAISLKHMIKNTEDIESLFDTDTTTTTTGNQFLSPIFEYFRNRPFATNMILANLTIIVIMIGGIKTFIFLIVLVAILAFGGGGDLNFPVKHLDGRTVLFFVVLAASVGIFTLARDIVGGNYKIKSKARNGVAIVLLLLLTLSFVALSTRVFSIYFGYSKRWELSLFEILEED